MNENWEDPPDDDGLTLGPEEALQREVEKSKALKVDRLRLRGEIEKFKTEKADLIQKNQHLKKRISALESHPSSEEANNSSSKALLTALGFGFLVLLFFMTRN